MWTDVNPLKQLPAPWTALVQSSRALLHDTQDARGGWPASPGFAPYQYSWFRDGSFIAEGASAAGLHTEADAFHAWCTSVLEREVPAVDAVVTALAQGHRPADSDYLPARYSLDGTRHEDDWWNFQVDGYGTWLWALSRHLDRTGGPVGPHAAAIETATRYLIATGRDSCRDWWEENRDQVHVATLAGVVAGLRAAVRLEVSSDLAGSAARVADAAVDDILSRGVRDGHLVKWLDGDAVDASLLSVAALYDVLPLEHPVVRRTVELIEERLAPTCQGVHRYEADTFYGGGQWPVLGALLAWHHARTGSLDAALARLDWVVSVADDEHLLPEQVAPQLAPEVLPEWLERWGPSAHPLVWSHGMFLGALAQLPRGRSAGPGPSWSGSEQA